MDYVAFNGSPAQCQWFMDRCGITRVALGVVFNVTIRNVLNRGNFTLADWLFDEGIDPRPLLETANGPDQLNWYFGHGAILLDSDSYLLRRVYISHHLKRLGTAHKLWLVPIPMQFNDESAYYEYMEKHLRLGKIWSARAAPYAFTVFVVSKERTGNSVVLVNPKIN
jgi:hypothetical protein